MEEIGEGTWRGKELDEFEVPWVGAKSEVSAFHLVLEQWELCLPILTGVNFIAVTAAVKLLKMSSAVSRTDWRFQCSREMNLMWEVRVKEGDTVFQLSRPWFTKAETLSWTLYSLGNQCKTLGKCVPGDLFLNDISCCIFRIYPDAFFRVCGTIPRYELQNLSLVRNKYMYCCECLQNCLGSIFCSVTDETVLGFRCCSFLGLQWHQVVQKDHSAAGQYRCLRTDSLEEANNLNFYLLKCNFLNATLLKDLSCSSSKCWLCSTLRQWGYETNNFPHSGDVELVVL